MALKTYQDKRSFDATPEPAAEAGQPDEHLRFVVQKHDASHLHYDFRLENNGVLLSWAVPKGPSLNPSDKRLAMQTEDHPYNYQYFEGVIPAGNYGAGQVIIWDSGTYEAIDGGSKAEQEKQLRQGLHQGKLSFRLHGHKLKGEFSLVKTDRKGQNAWLLIKKADQAASDSDITTDDKSVISGQPVEAVQQTAFNPEEWRALIQRYDLPKRNLERPLKPMLATLVDQPFSDSDWLFEIKWDGYRAVAEISRRQVKLYSRNQKDFNRKYPEVAEALQGSQHDMIVDGEIVRLDTAGKPSFGDLQNYHPGRGDSPVYYVFDLLWLDGYDLTAAPLIVRKRLLEKVLPAGQLIRYSDHVLADGERFLRLAGEQDLEGIMAKRQDSHYLPDRRSKNWLKLKCSQRQEAVIGGFTEPRGGRKGLGALILGVHQGDELVYIGHSGTGLSDRQLTDLRTELTKLERKTSPFKDPPKPNAPVHWVKPTRLVEVTFSEWTKSGHMRHPRLVGIRSDKPAEDVVREQPEAVDIATVAAEAQPEAVEFSHLDKVFFPAAKLTKGDLVGYYQAMTDWLLPYVKGRPMTLLRHPNGIDGQAFFQKDMSETLLAGFETFRRYSESNHKDINYFVCQDRQSLLYMVQLGCIEINPWNSTAAQSDRPDWLVLDLDPEAIGFNKVVEVALDIRQLLDGLDIVSYVKTSGKTGIHIYLPLLGQYDYDQTKQFAELLAKTAHQRQPALTSVERSPSKRQGKIYLDFLQNRIGQTLASPYSVRPTPSATVSMPLEWSQITASLKPTDFTIKNVPDIVAKRPDPWRNFWQQAVDIQRVLAKL